MYGVLNVIKTTNKRIDNKELAYIQVEKNNIHDVVLCSPGKALEYLKQGYTIKMI